MCHNTTQGIGIGLFAISLILSHVINIYYFSYRNTSIKSRWFHDLLFDKYWTNAGTIFIRLYYAIYRAVLFTFIILNLELYNKLQKLFYLYEFRSLYSVAAFFVINDPSLVFSSILKHLQTIFCCGYFQNYFDQMKRERNWKAFSLYKMESDTRRLWIINELEAECVYIPSIVLLNFTERIPQLIAVGMIGGWFNSWINTVKFILSVAGLLKSIKGIFSIWEHYGTINLFTNTQDPNHIEPPHVNMKYDFRVEIPSPDAKEENNSSDLADEKEDQRLDKPRSKSQRVPIRVRTYYNGRVLFKNLRTEETKLITIDESSYKLPDFMYLSGYSSLPPTLKSLAELFVQGEL